VQSEAKLKFSIWLSSFNPSKDKMALPQINRNLQMLFAYSFLFILFHTPKNFQNDHRTDRAFHWCGAGPFLQDHSKIENSRRYIYQGARLFGTEEKEFLAYRVCVQAARISGIEGHKFIQDL